jgi:diguanylate cyclase (GGDEF)-like protein
VSWYGGGKTGTVFAFATTLIILGIHIFLGLQYAHTYELVLSTISRFCAYVLLSLLVVNFRALLNVEVVAASTDALTGVLNVRAFHLELANEILRSIRYKHTFSLAYIDIDNFKKINDTLGHAVGDELLLAVANCLETSLRKTDSVARVGGDEFTVLLPEAEQGEAKDAFFKVGKNLEKIMKNRNWQVSFSIGIVTFEKLPHDINEAMSIADELMYSVKNNEKNDIAYQLWKGKA